MLLILWGFPLIFSGIYLAVLWKLNGTKLLNKKWENWEHLNKTWKPRRDTQDGDYFEMIDEDADYTDNGEECKSKCGKEDLYKNKNWCWKVSGSWDYCTIKSGKN